jgi:hypothetical protein
MTAKRGSRGQDQHFIFSERLPGLLEEGKGENILIYLDSPLWPLQSGKQK